MYLCIMYCMVEAVDPVLLMYLIFVLIVWNLYPCTRNKNCLQSESESENPTDGHGSNVNNLRDKRIDVINDKDISSEQDERWHLERQLTIQKSKMQKLLEIERDSYKERECESKGAINKIEDNIEVINERIKTLEAASQAGKHEDTSAASNKVEDKQSGKMREPDYLNIQTHMVYLLDNIQDPVYLCLSLFSHGVFDWDDVEKIKRCHATGTREATEQLLFILMYCGENAYGRFLECLREVGLDQVINELEHSRYGESNRQQSEEERLLAERRGLLERVKEKEEKLREAVTEKEHNFQKLQEDNQRINMELEKLRNQMTKMENENQGDKDERVQEIGHLRERKDELLNVQNEIREKQQRIPNEIQILESHVEDLKAATISGDKELPKVESDITNLCTLLQECVRVVDDKDISSEQEERWQRVGQVMIQQFKDQRESEISNLQKAKGSYKERECGFADTINDLKHHIEDISEQIKTIRTPGEHKDPLSAPKKLPGRQRGQMRDPDYHNIQTHMVYLLNNIRDPKRLCLSLFSRGVFDQNDVELIFRCYDDGTREATEKLLFIVMHCGEDAYQRFLECLRDVGLNQVINELEQNRYGESSNQQTEEQRLIAERRGLLEWVQEKEEKLQETVKEKKHDVEELQIENKRINMELAELRNVITKMETEQQGNVDERGQEIVVLRDREDELLKNQKELIEKQQTIPNEIHNLEADDDDDISSETEKRWHDEQQLMIQHFKDKRDSEISKLESQKESGLDSTDTIKKLEEHIENISTRIKTLEAPSSPGGNKESSAAPRRLQDKQIGMMRKSDYQNIQENMMYLIDNIQDPIRLSFSLFAFGVFDRNDVEKIKRCYNISTRDATQNLLFIVMYCGENAYQGFVECLREEGLEQVINELEQSRHQESVKQQIEELRLQFEKVQEKGESLREVVKERESDIRTLKGENERINVELVDLRDEMAKLENDKQGDKEGRIKENERINMELVELRNEMAKLENDKRGDKEGRIKENERINMELVELRDEMAKLENDKQGDKEGRIKENERINMELVELRNEMAKLENDKRGDKEGKIKENERINMELVELRNEMAKLENDKQGDKEGRIKENERINMELVELRNEMAKLENDKQGDKEARKKENERINMELVELRDEMAKLENDKQGDKEGRIKENERINMELVELRNEMAKLENDKRGDKEGRIKENERINMELVELRNEMTKLENDKQGGKEGRIKEIDDKIHNDLKKLELRIQTIENRGYWHCCPPGCSHEHFCYHE